MYEYKNKIFNMDCLAGMAMLPDSSVDMVLTDLPYGTTAGAWDILIPFDHLWAELHRVAKPNAAMVFTAAQPFTTQLIQSNQKDKDTASTLRGRNRCVLSSKADI